MIAKKRSLPHFDHSLRPSYRWDGRTLPFKPPNAPLPHVLDKIRHECDEAGTARPTRGRINDPVAGGFGAELFGERLTSRVAHTGIVMQGWLGVWIDPAKIVEFSVEVGDQLRIIRSILESGDCFELAGEVVGYFVDRGLNLESAVPCTSVLAVKSIPTRPCVCERGVYQGVTGTTEDEFAWVQLREARLLCFQPPVGDALQAGEIFQRFMVRSEW